MKTLLTALGLMTVSTLVLAGPPKAPSFSDLDSDGDGLLSQQEVSADRMLSKRFSEIDTDLDGYLTEDELAAAGPGSKGGPGGKGSDSKGGRGGQPPSFADLDTDGDGLISQSEASSDRMLADHFDQMDQDGDGYLTEDEMRPPHRER